MLLKCHPGLIRDRARQSGVLHSDRLKAFDPLEKGKRADEGSEPPPIPQPDRRARLRKPASKEQKTMAVTEAYSTSFVDGAGTRLDEKSGVLVG